MTDRRRRGPEVHLPAWDDENLGARGQDSATSWDANPRKLTIQNDGLWRLVEGLWPLVGNELVWYIVHDARTRFDQLSTRHHLDPDDIAYASLVTVRDIVDRATLVDGGMAAIRNWFRRKNPRLGDRSPLSVITSNREGVGRAAIHFLDEELKTRPPDYDQQWREERQQLLSRARERFGDPLAEVILTHEPDHLLTLNSAAVGLTDEEVEPLRNALSIADYLSAREANSVIRAWFAGLNPMLGEREPALVIRDNPQAVRNAAQAHLASG